MQVILAGVGVGDLALEEFVPGECRGLARCGDDAGDAAGGRDDYGIGTNRDGEGDMIIGHGALRSIALAAVQKGDARVKCGYTVAERAVGGNQRNIESARRRGRGSPAGRA